MAITLDATLSGATSNSYITLADAEAIAANLPGGDDWTKKTADEKNLSLIEATRWLETLSYSGTRCKDTQRLKWPRKDAKCDGVTSVCTAIPYKIQEAEVSLAIAYDKDPDQFPGIGGGGSSQRGVYTKRQKLGDLEVEFEQYAGTNVTSCDSCNDPVIITAFPWLKDLLSCYLIGVSGGVGLMYRVRS